MAPGAEPLSIESLLQKQKEEREAAARASISSIMILFVILFTSISAQVPVQGRTRKDCNCKAGSRDSGREKKRTGEPEEQGTT
jgi:hypothetical protein